MGVGPEFAFELELELGRGTGSGTGTGTEAGPGPGTEVALELELEPGKLALALAQAVALEYVPVCAPPGSGACVPYAWPGFLLCDEGRTSSIGTRASWFPPMMSTSTETLGKTLPQ